MCERDIIDVLVTGNGFDLHHCLPTRYCDFLDVMNRLVELDGEGNLNRCQYLKYVFGPQSPLYNINPMIKKCYDIHSNVIVNMPLEIDGFASMVCKIKTNLWLKYFRDIHFERPGWIDFEKEMSEIISVFRRMIGQLNCVEKGYSPCLEDMNLAQADYFVLMQNAFEDFFINIEGWHVLRDEYWNIRGEGDGKVYCSVNEKSVATKLYTDLEELVDVLDWYITEFIQKIAVNQKSYNLLFEQCQRVVNFNYTNTFSILYDGQHEKPVFYIHGSAEKDNMVLGINDDETDQLKALNLSFVEFKKYYQRTFKQTDYDYEKILPNGGNYRLHFVGHSMDATDQDILKLLIEDEKTTQSIIYYHDEMSHKQLIINTIALFGKDEFERLKREHKIEFQKLEAFEANKE